MRPRFQRIGKAQLIPGICRIVGPRRYDRVEWQTGERLLIVDVAGDNRHGRGVAT
jgi:hypothetical protein